MLLWRISRHRELTGAGGLRAAGRWHQAGQPIVYLSETPAGALLGVCVHTAAGDTPPGFTLLRIETPEPGPAVASLLPKDLRPGWQTRLGITRALGMRWLAAGQTALLRVPSAVIPHTWNVLLNPSHPDAAQLRITEALEYPFDARLKT